MDNILEKFKELELNKQIELEDIPELDLYMDQVIQLFESKLSNGTRSDEDKVLTKTMINNYAKGKLLMKVNNKKYSKEHLILMSLIYNLKSGLSISDIKSVLDNIVEANESGEPYPLRELYRKVLSQYNRDFEDVEALIEKKAKEITLDIDNSKEESEYEKNFIMLCSFMNMSNMYKRMSQKLIDDYFTKEQS